MACGSSAAAGRSSNIAVCAAITTIPEASAAITSHRAQMRTRRSQMRLKSVRGGPARSNTKKVPVRRTPRVRSTQ
jgi:hypothetical protein